MKKVIRLTESDLHKIIKKVIKEEESDWWTKYGFDNEESFNENYENVNEYASKLSLDVEDEIRNLLINFFDQTGVVRIVEEIVKSRQKMFKERYPQYSNVGEFINWNIDDLLTANTNLDSEEIMDELTEEISIIFSKIIFGK
jgi:cellulose biosynthesis protein BcsQ